MFAQALQNSVYSYAVILVVFLLALAAGSFVAAWLARRRWPVVPTLSVLLCAAALLVASTPHLFFLITDGLGYLSSRRDWLGYLFALANAALIILAAPTLVLGVVFPYLWKAADPGGGTTDRGAGEQVGGLLALNTTGAILGSLAAGFLLLEWLGLWRSIQWLAGLYLAAAVLLMTIVPARGQECRTRFRPALAVAPLLGFLLLLSVLDAGRLPAVRTDPVRRDETLLEVREGGAATVAVVRRGDHRGIKVDNHYTLGSTRGHGLQQRQAHFPLLLHPEPRRVFLLGMGTGITAGAVLAHPVEQLVVAELLSDVVGVARDYFAPFAGGLFQDPRATILAEDGRHHLSATDATFDVVIGDLFVPWKRGNAALYSLEHFRNVAERLAPNGLFAQWVPLYQLTEQEFGIIARTFTAAFAHVTLWRGDFLPEGPIVALLGRGQSRPLDPTLVQRRADALITGASKAAAERTRESVLPNPETPPLLLYYAGNLGRAADLFAAYPLNTVDRPALQFSAARSQRAEAAGRGAWFVGEPLIALFNRILEHAPLAEDPYLARLTPQQRETVFAGLDIFAARLAEARGKGAEFEALLARAGRRLTPQQQPNAEAAELRRALDALRAERDTAVEALERRIRGLQGG